MNWKLLTAAVLMLGFYTSAQDKATTQQQEVVAVYDRECIQEFHPGLGYHIEAQIDSVTGQIKKNTAVGVGPISVSIRPGCQARLEVRRKN